MTAVTQEELVDEAVSILEGIEVENLVIAIQRGFSYWEQLELKEALNNLPHLSDEED